MTTGVKLRPPRATDNALLRRLRTKEVAAPFNWFSDLPGEQLDRRLIGADRLIVELEGGQAVGDVGWFGVPYGPNKRSLAWKIGITLLPEYRGQGIGTAAQRLLADHLFATTTANRVEADTDLENQAEQRSLEKAGFRKEGILRGAQYRDGAWRDMVLYARLRSDA